MNEQALSQLYLKDTAFQNLMQRRIFNVLLIASPYDAFMMEEDGRVEEQLYMEYVSLNLSSPPRVTRVSHVSEALEALAQKPFDLIIAMPGGDISETFTGAGDIKEQYPNIPFVVLTPFSKEVSRRLQGEDFRNIDYVFSWLGNMDVLLAIIKLLEDKMNAQADILDVGVQMILLVEDSVRFYSSVLPHLYKFILKQSKEFSTEALNEHERMLRMRGRPKVMLARDYEEATQIYTQYSRNILGIVSDVSFKRNGEKEPLAGIEFARFVRHNDPYIPIIIESSEAKNAAYVDQFNGVFLDKNSKKLPVDLGDAITANFGFGDFVIRNPRTQDEIMRIKSLKDLQKRIFEIPDEALHYHARHNDISRWLYSRALFPIAEVVKMHRFYSLDEAPAVKQLLFDLIVKYRKMKNRGVVAVFQKDRFDHYSNFARIGQGSLGGKGRGLAFVDSIIKKNPICDNLDGVTISIPRTVVLCTDIFDEFMAENKLYPLALSNAADADILKAFQQARLPKWLRDDLNSLLDVVDRPLAIRSSSLLEDSHYQPFAGIYSTYMIPRIEDDREAMLNALTNAIKGVYASVFYAASKAYMTATSNVIDQEKMAVIIQEVVGEYHGDYYFPSLSGVGRSLNYYPVGEEATEDGICQIAVGLGKYIVDGGGHSLRFSPKYPANVLQTSTLDLALRDTQTSLMALQRRPSIDEFDVDDGFTLTPINIQEYAGTGALNQMVSVYDHQNNMLVDYDNPAMRGRRVVTFNNILRDQSLPLAKAVDFMLAKGRDEMRRPVEIEFAANIAPKAVDGIKGHIYWLQIRPIIDTKNMVDDTILDVDDTDLILRSDSALGHGNIEGVNTIVYVKPETFDSQNNSQISAEIEKINANFTADNIPYILIGPGRWGSSDPALGIPVKWADISGAKVIVESALPGYRIEPSQGTHFFQNLTSFGVGYLTIDTPAGNGFLDMDYLNSLPAEYESDHIRIVKFEQPLTIGINGHRSLAAVHKQIQK